MQRFPRLLQPLAGKSGKRGDLPPPGVACIVPQFEQQPFPLLRIYERQPVAVDGEAGESQGRRGNFEKSGLRFSL